MGTFIVGVLTGGTLGFFLSALLRANDNNCEECELNNTNKYEGDIE